MVNIYAMLDPGESQTLRYIGQTRGEISKRRGAHVSEARHGKTGRLYDWIRSLLQAGQQPLMQLIERVEDDQADESERFWIATMWDQGASLFNRKPGGRGSFPVRVIDAGPFDWHAIDRDYSARGL